MRIYLENNFGWFFRLRDLRDFVSHCSTLDIRFYEPKRGKIIISTCNGIDLVNVLKESVDGLNNFIEFFNEHFKRRIKNGC